MVRHGSSHGLAVLVCTVLGSLIVELLKPHFPRIIDALSTISNKMVSWLTNYLPIPLSSDQFTVIIVASILGLIWGIFFKLSLHKE